MYECVLAGCVELPRALRTDSSQTNRFARTRASPPKKMQVTAPGRREAPVHQQEQRQTSQESIFPTASWNKQFNALPGRLELPTLRLTASRSNQLSYGSLVVNSACNHQGRAIARRGTQWLCQRSPGVEGRTPKCPTTKAIWQNIACKYGHTSIGCEQGAICGAAAAQNKFLLRSPPDGEGVLDFDAFSRSQVGARIPGDCRKKKHKNGVLSKNRYSPGSTHISVFFLFK